MICNNCGGTGYIKKLFRKPTCVNCSGTGHIRDDSEDTFVGGLDIIETIPIVIEQTWGGGEVLQDTPVAVEGDGGSFGGAGASDSWSNDSSSCDSSSSDSGGGSSDGGSGGE